MERGPLTAGDAVSLHAGGLRARLGAAACLLLATAGPTAAHAADAGAGTPVEPPDSASARWQFDGSTLLYGERQRTNVIEPIARITRLLGGGQMLSAGLALDAITGASPTGALPTGVASPQGGEDRVQTVTAASGSGSSGTKPGDVPTRAFSDFRGALDVGWVRPLGSLLTFTTGAHYSREKDYQSLGASGQLSLDLMQRLTTLTLGAAGDHDGVFPTGGTPVGLDSIAPRASGSNPKHVTSGMVGLSRILTRRWMVAVNASRTRERGYLTEPYKVLSIVDANGYPVSQLPEKRPGERIRSDVLANSVYHLARDVLYTSYRYYWDDWHIRSHTVDVKLRHELDDGAFVQPHVRLYTQSAAGFFRDGFAQDALTATGLPAYASSDDRLGVRHGVTLGATYGFRVPNFAGDFTVRVEYLRQWGTGHPADAVGVQRGFDLAPGVDIGMVTAGYTVQF
jgi:uncharacterized protein DUF3570